MSDQQRESKNNFLNYFNKNPNNETKLKNVTDNSAKHRIKFEKRLLDESDDEYLQPVKRQKTSESGQDITLILDTPNDEGKSKLVTPTKCSQWRSQKSNDTSDDESDMTSDEAEYPTRKKICKRVSECSNDEFSINILNRKIKWTSRSSANIYNHESNILIDEIRVKYKNFTSKSQKPRHPNLSELQNREERFVEERQLWIHNKLEFLKPERIRDKNCRRPSDPGYDKSTLYVPQKFIAKQIHIHQQWWILKCDYFDCVLFFKIGKFYELYHMDADVGVNELRFSYLKDDFAHCRFPESVYSLMELNLIELGYKVACVDVQTHEMPKRLKNKQYRAQHHIKSIESQIREERGEQYELHKKLDSLILC